MTDNRFWPSPYVASHWCAWTPTDPNLCYCCNSAEAITATNVWQCQRRPEKRWQLFPPAEMGWNVQKNYEHPVSECRGNCTFHPLRQPDFPGGAMQGHGGWLWDGPGATACLADFAELCYAEEEAKMTPAKRAALEERERLESEQRHIEHEQMIREIYAADVKQRAMRGLRKGEAPKTLVAPCKWVIGEFKGQECWAWEYTDPKTGKRMCPHTCNRLHPGQSGWHNEWFSNRNWKPPVPAAPPPPPPNRFVSALAAPVDARLRGGRSTPTAPPAPAVRARPNPLLAPSRWAHLEESDSEEGGLDAW